MLETLLAQLAESARTNRESVRELVNTSYDDIITSISVASLPHPEFNELFELFTAALVEEQVILCRVNSETEAEQLLDDRGQLRLRTPMNIFVGGQILDRGVTIENLIGFYYGRSPQRFQQDTVLQHSRMYGARSINDLAVTRFYTTSRIYEAMRQMHEFDTALREAIERGDQNRGVYFLRQDDRGQIIPCSPNKILLSGIMALRPLRRLLPYGFQTISRSAMRRPLRDLDSLVDTLAPDEQVHGISLRNVETLFDLMKETLVFEEGFEFDWDTTIAALEFLSNQLTDRSTANEVLVIARRGRENSRMRSDGVRFFDAPDTSHIEGVIARREAIDTPMLMLFRQEGREEQGWRGSPFWWPVIYTPVNTPISIFARRMAT